VNGELVVAEGALISERYPGKRLLASGGRVVARD